jgi:formylglycine-generating enzyme required for sulfatase activity
MLPTEAQWEYAARAGTTTPWWTGQLRESLIDAANLADQAAQRAGAVWPAIADWPDLDDGYWSHAPVDTLRANPWGLHHVHGNVHEWCRDWITFYEKAPAPDDGLRDGDASTTTGRTIRGGSHVRSADEARVSYRLGTSPTARTADNGVRAARRVWPAR